MAPPARIPSPIPLVLLHFLCSLLLSASLPLGSASISQSIHVNVVRTAALFNRDTNSKHTLKQLYQILKNRSGLGSTSTSVPGATSNSTATSNSSTIIAQGNSNSSASTGLGSKVMTAYFWPGLPAGTQAGAVEYHDGPVLTNEINVYPIFYGSWFGDFGESVLRGFINSTGTTSLDGQAVPSVHEWWALTAPYYQSVGGKRTSVAQKLNYKKSITLNKGFITTLGDGFDGGNNDVEQIVTKQITKGALPEDPNGFYPVIVSGEIQVRSGSGGLCVTYCGWHNLMYGPQGKALKYALIGDGTKRCNWGCGHNLGLQYTPNGYYSMDSLMSTFAHELVEAATDPDVSTGWYSLGESGGYENADLCNGIYKDSNIRSLPLQSKGPKAYGYNMHGEGKLKYLVQGNVDLKTQTCVLRHKA